MHACMCICVYACTCTVMHMHMHMHMQVHRHMHMHMHMHMHVCVCIYIHIIWIFPFAYAHMHMHTYTPAYPLAPLEPSRWSCAPSWLRWRTRGPQCNILKFQVSYSLSEPWKLPISWSRVQQGLQCSFMLTVPGPFLGVCWRHFPCSATRHNPRVQYGEGPHTLSETTLN